jgi:hypothetical protein
MLRSILSNVINTTKISQRLQCSCQSPNKLPLPLSSGILRLRPLIILMLLPTFPEHLKLYARHRISKKFSVTVNTRDIEQNR